MGYGPEWPEEGELVVCAVTKVKNFGAFVTLEEYGGKEGFIHIAEVARGWIKYIRDYIRESQKVVCKVLRVDADKGHIDLSLKAVNEHQRREKIQEWKNAQKAEKLLELVTTRMEKDMEWAYDTFVGDLVEAFGSLYTAFEEAAIDAGVL
ncbi:MAG: S1 RNA-binding domain-containing protein, partial [Thermoplasmata archaeon]|nr:S1 RNA-binding domain-containing protein [Thermoplasmata archaeon]